MILIDDISKRTISVLAEILDVNTSSINIGSCSTNTRGWDSFATMQFIVGVEKEFNITLEIEDAQRFTSIEYAVEILIKKYLR